MKFDKAQKVADAVLYEGYLLYPYRASATKNQARWQFGVVMPRDYIEDRGSEPWVVQTECLLEPGDAPVLDLRLRFLQVQTRVVEQAVKAEQKIFLPVETLNVDGQRITAWDEGIERQVDHVGIDVAEICGAERGFHFALPAGKEKERRGGYDGETQKNERRERSR